MQKYLLVLYYCRVILKLTSNLSDGVAMLIHRPRVIVNRIMFRINRIINNTCYSFVSLKQYRTVFIVSLFLMYTAGCVGGLDSLCTHIGFEPLSRVPYVRYVKTTSFAMLAPGHVLQIQVRTPSL